MLALQVLSLLDKNTVTITEYFFQTFTLKKTWPFVESTCVSGVANSLNKWSPGKLYRPDSTVPSSDTSEIWALAYSLYKASHYSYNNFYIERLRDFIFWELCWEVPYYSCTLLKTRVLRNLFVKSRQRALRLWSSFCVLQFAFCLF